MRTLADDELAGGRGRGMNGIHRPDGIWIAHGGPGAVRALRDAAPALLAALGVPWREVDGTPRDPRPYTPQEEAQVARRLRALGYLE